MKYLFTILDNSFKANYIAGNYTDRAAGQIPRKLSLAWSNCEGGPRRTAYT